MIPPFPVSALVQSATQALANYSEAINCILDPTIKKEHEHAHLMLEAMLTHAPTAEGSDYVADSINKCTNDNERQQLGIMYRNNLILPFKAKGGKTPAVTSHPSKNETFERLSISAILDSAKRDGNKLRYAVLKRDNRRCLITGDYDVVRFLELSPNIPDAHWAHVEAAHIIPFCLAKADTAAQANKSAAVWVIIRAFSGIEVEELNGQEMNRLENAMTLSTEAHISFGDLLVWLEPVEGKQHTYYVRKAHAGVLSRSVLSDSIVQFTSSSPDMALPDPRYLALHAACARIAHVSGAAAYIDALREEWEETTVLSSDGSSADMFHQKLHLAQILAH